MGRLRGAERSVPLRADHLVGRGERADLRLADPRVSTEHARVRWVDGAWRVRDLGSRNGTWVDGIRLESGGEVAAGAGSAIAFADPTAPWEVDAAAPMPFAEAPDGTFVEGEGDALFLVEHAMIYGTEGGWFVDQDGEVAAITDRAVLVVQGAPFALALPGAVASTLDADASIDLDRLILEFDGASGVVCVAPDGPRRLKPAAAHQLLLTLAKERVYDAGEGVAEAEQGWVEVADVCRWLDAHENRINVDVFRLRKQLAEIGVVGAARLVERRPLVRRLRIGVPAARIRVPT